MMLLWNIVNGVKYTLYDSYGKIYFGLIDCKIVKCGLCYLVSSPDEYISTIMYQ